MSINIFEIAQCPFCKETDFDLVGLKHHFDNGYCDVFNAVDDLYYTHKESENDEKKAQG